MVCALVSFDAILHSSWFPQPLLVPCVLQPWPLAPKTKQNHSWDSNPSLTTKNLLHHICLLLAFWSFSSNAAPPPSFLPADDTGLQSCCTGQEEAALALERCFPRQMQYKPWGSRWEGCARGNGGIWLASLPQQAGESSSVSFQPAALASKEAGCGGVGLTRLMVPYLLGH